MKKKRFKLTTLCLLIAALLYGQNDDLQWLIWNAKGKWSTNGTSPETNKYTNPGSVLTSTMTFLGVSIPNTDANPDPRNDLFIIYDDGTHQNTRGVPGMTAFFAGMSSPIPTSTSFIAPAGKNILYGYQTNIYEGDDVPTGVRINNMSGSSPITLAVTSPATLISANHEVVFTKDITLIINNDSLLQAPDINQKELDTYVLTFDGVQEINAPNSIWTGVNILDPKDIFGTSESTRFPLYPLPSSSPVSAESISLDPTRGPYSYVNLRPNTGAESYQPARDGTAKYRAIFTVYKNGGFVSQHTEPIRFSHDPNFLQVLNIYRTSDGGHMVTYHLEFENTSTTPTTYLRAEAVFPDHFDLTNINVVNWSAKGNPCGGRLDFDRRTPRRVIFDIDDHQLLRCTPTAPEQGKGFIEFKVKVNPGYDVRDISNSLELTNPNVFFDNIPYLITDFRDLIECDNRHSEEPAFTHEPNYSGNPEAKFVNGPKGLSHVCSRPMSEPPTTCPLWIWVLGGLLLLVLIVILIVRIMRKKPTPPPPSPES